MSQAGECSVNIAVPGLEGVIAVGKRGIADLNGAGRSFRVDAAAKAGRIAGERAAIDGQRPDIVNPTAKPSTVTGDRAIDHLDRTVFVVDGAALQVGCIAGNCAHRERERSGVIDSRPAEIDYLVTGDRAVFDCQRSGVGDSATEVESTAGPVVGYGALVDREIPLIEHAAAIGLVTNHAAIDRDAPGDRQSRKDHIGARKDLKHSVEPGRIDNRRTGTGASDCEGSRSDVQFTRCASISPDCGMLSVYVPAGTVIVLLPPRASASMIAERRVITPVLVGAVPLPGWASTASVVLLTRKVARRSRRSRLSNDNAFRAVRRRWAKLVARPPPNKVRIDSPSQVLFPMRFHVESDSR